MPIERRFANRFETGEEAHAFETHVRGAALEAGLSLGPCGVEDTGRLGNVAHFVLTGEAEALDRFAAERHGGERLTPA